MAHVVKKANGEPPSRPSLMLLPHQYSTRPFAAAPPATRYALPPARYPSPTRVPPFETGAARSASASRRQGAKPSSARLTGRGENAAESSGHGAIGLDFSPMRRYANGATAQGFVTVRPTTGASIDEGWDGSFLEKVEAALADLADLKAAAGGAALDDGAYERGSASHSSTGRFTDRRPQMKEVRDIASQKLQERVEMSRGIMRKLYRKNVELEKEVQLLKMQASSAAEHSNPATPAAMSSASTEPAGTSSVLTLRLPLGQSSALQTLQERDQTIAELQAVIGVLQSRLSSTEATLLQGGARKGDKSQAYEAIEQSQLHYSKYKTIRADYHRLLNRRVETVRRSTGAAKEAKIVVGELKDRLSKEINERETEAALYSARLYQSEQRQSDWYVEKRLLEQTVTKLQGDIQERDRIDAQIESCVGALFDRMRMLEVALVTAGVSITNPADVESK